MNARTFCLTFLLAAGALVAQPVVAPSPDRTGTFKGVDLRTYNVTNSFELGYRFTDVDGDRDFFRNTENFGNGIRLFNAGVTITSKDGHGRLFDVIALNAQGLGNDPYGLATLRIEKNQVYRYDMTWRQNDYFNTPIDNGASATLMNTRRVLQDHELTATVASWAKLKLGYTRNHQTGPMDSNYEMYIGGLARTVLPLDQDVLRDYNEYRLGTQLDLLGFRLTLSHQWEYSKNDTTTYPLIPGEPYPLPLSQPYQASLPVTYPFLGTSYTRSQPMHGVNRVWIGNLNRSTKLWALNARMTYSKGDTDSIYFETETGARAAANSTCSNCGSGAPASTYTFMPGNGRRPFTAGDFTASFFPTDRLTIVNSTSAENNRYDGTGQMLQQSSVAATKNIFWTYQIGNERFSDSLDVNYRLTRWLGLNSEYRYTARWLTNNLFRTGTTNSKDLNVLNSHLNAATFGFRLKPLKPLSVDVDGTIGRDNAALTPVSPAHYHTIRARVDYRQNRRIRFGGAYREVYNLNAPVQTVFTSTYGVPPASYYASHSRVLSGSASLALNDGWSIDASYNKLHLDTMANLWIEEPAPNSTTIVSVPGYISRYISNVHNVSVMARSSLKKRATLYFGYNISKDTGDGRKVQDLGLTDPAAKFLAGVNTFPMTYQSPIVRLSFKITPKIQWNGGWEFYKYNQQFAYFGYQPWYRTHSGYTSLSFTF